MPGSPRHRRLGKSEPLRAALALSSPPSTASELCESARAGARLRAAGIFEHQCCNSLRGNTNQRHWTLSLRVQGEQRRPRASQQRSRIRACAHYFHGRKQHRRRRRDYDRCSRCTRIRSNDDSSEWQTVERSRYCCSFPGTLSA